MQKILAIKRVCLFKLIYMKSRLLLLLSVLALYIGKVNAQVTNYALLATSSTYSDIVGGTEVTTSTSAADFLQDTRTSTNIPIGFTFNFNGTDYTQARAWSDGVLSFNLTASSTPTNNLKSGTTGRPLLAPLWDDLDGNISGAAANYITTGIAPNRVFTIEWKNWQWNWGASGNTISFQVKLYETSNSIEYIYRQESGTVSSGSASIGMAATATGNGNFLALNNPSTTPTASSTTEVTTLSTKPATGQSYLFYLPTCIAPTAITTSSLSTTSATVVWTAPSSAPASGYSYYLSSTSTPPAVTAAPTGTVGAGVTSLGFSSLTANTNYYIWVRSICSGTDSSIWNGGSFYTGHCVPASTTGGTYISSFSTTGGTTNIANTSTYATAGYQNNFASMNVTSYDGGSFVFNSSLVGGSAGYAIWVDWNNNLVFESSERVYNSAGYTVGPVTATITVPIGTAMGDYRMRAMVDYSSGTITNPCGFSSTRGEAEDYKLIVGTPPSCLPPGTPSVSTLTTTSATINWTEASPAPSDGYEYYYSTSSTAPIATTTASGTTAAGVLTASLSPLTPSTTYYVWVRSNCGGGDISTWSASAIFFTGYCTPAPTSVDGAGITNVTIKTINNTTGSEIGNYGDYSAMSFDAFATEEVILNITYSTGYTYGTKIWIDWNNNLTFETGELSYTGVSGSSNPSTLVASITVPTGTAVGTYRMRIGGTDNDAGPENPCYTGSYATFEDYTVNVTLPPSCIAPAAPTVGPLSTTAGTITWAEPATAPSDGYEYYYSTSSTAPDAMTTASGSTAAGVLTATLSPLTPSTTYYVWVRSNCGAGSYSTWSASTTFYTGTCVPASTAATTYISSFTTTGGTTNISNTSSFEGTGYADNFATMNVTSFAGGSFVFNSSIVGGSAGYAVWIDWNNNLSFETEERVFVTSSYITAPQTATITVPAGTAIGEYRMRALVDWSAGAPSNPCGFASTRGEVEDYKIIVSTPPAIPGCFTGTPSPADAAGICAMSTATTLTWTAVTDASSYDVYLSYVDVATTTLVGNVSTPSYTTAATLATGTYTWSIVPKNVTGTASGCTEYTFTVNPLPTVLVSPTTADICAGASTTLTASGAIDYLWTPSAGLSSDMTDVVTATPTATTTYSVTGTDANGCAATATSTVTVNALPATLTVTPATASECPGAIIAMTATGGDVVSTGSIGTGTTALSTTSYPNPISSFYGGAKHQMIYTAAELSGLGYRANSIISELALDVFTAGTSSNTCVDLTIRMKNTTSTSLSAFESGTSTVYGPTTWTPSTTGWNAFTLTTPFIWDGTSNVIVEFVHNAGNWGNGSGTSVTVTNTSTNMTYYGADDDILGGIPGFDALTSYGINGGSPNRPNVLLSGTVPGDITWSPAADLYTDAAATMAYTAGDTASTVYAMPTASVTYTATATSSAGCTATDSAAITINALPTITTQPANVAVCMGAVLDMNIVSDATSFQWLKEGVAVVGETSATLSIASSTAADAGNYSVALTNAAGCADTSTIAVATINAMPTITTQPANTSFCTGTSLDLSIVSDATTFQWLKEGVAIVGETSATLSIATASASDAGNYSVALGNAAGCVDTSDIAVATALLNATITATSSDNTSCTTPDGSITITAPEFVDGDMYELFYNSSSHGVKTVASGAIVITGLDAGTVNNITLVNGSCFSNNITATIVGGTAAGAGSPTPVTSSNTGTQLSGSNVSYFDASCNIIASVNATGGDLGAVSAEAVVEASAGVINGQPYLQRHFEITAANAGVPAAVTVYMLQSEIDNYNTNNDTFPDIDAALSNLKITAYHNAAMSGGDGPDGHDTADAELITPTTATFNAAADRWEVTFATTGFSGFYVHTSPTNAPLSIEMGNAHAYNEGNVNIVKWNSLDESSASHFDVQRSTDARTFSNIGSEAANGQASDYIFTDKAPFKGVNHYRIVMLDVNGKAIYSNTVSVNTNTGNQFAINAFPNPTQNNVTLSVVGTKGIDAKVFVTDVTGKVVYQSMDVLTTQITIPMETLPQGVYIIKYTDSENTSSVKVTKQ